MRNWIPKSGFTKPWIERYLRSPYHCSYIYQMKPLSWIVWREDPCVACHKVYDSTVKNITSFHKVTQFIHSNAVVWKPENILLWQSSKISSRCSEGSRKDRVIMAYGFMELNVNPNFLLSTCLENCLHKCYVFRCLHIIICAGFPGRRLGL